MDNQTSLLSQGNFYAQSNKEIEEIVLATFINYPDTYFYYSSQLSANCFDYKENKDVYLTIEACAKNSQIDLITIRAKLIENGTVNYYLKKKVYFDILAHVDDICDRIQTDQYIEEHIKILIQFTKRRELLKFGSGIVTKVNEMIEPNEIINTATSDILKIHELSENKEFNINVALSEVTANLSIREQVTGQKTFLQEIDNFIYQFDPGNLIIVAGPAGMGKTSFVLDILRRRILNTIPSAIFSLEMKNMELMNKIMSSEAEIPFDVIRRKQMGQEHWEQWHDAVARLEDKPFFIDDKSRDVYKIGNRIKQLYLRYGVKLFVIDYLQLMTISLNGRTNREQEVATMSRYLKELASELGVVIIALSQLNREVAKRENKRPVLSDLRESGAIEQDADAVIFVYRNDYYMIEKISGPVQETEIIFAKLRNGNLNNGNIVKLNFNSTFGKFISLSDNKFIYGTKIQTPENPDENPF